MSSSASISASTEVGSDSLVFLGAPLSRMREGDAAVRLADYVGVVGSESLSCKVDKSTDPSGVLLVLLSVLPLALLGVVPPVFLAGVSGVPLAAEAVARDEAAVAAA